MSIVVRVDKGSCTGIVEDGNVQELEERWFGERSGDVLVLNVIELSYLLLTGKAVADVEGKTVRSLEDLMKTAVECFKDYSWSNLVVYKDLRDRGRRVRIVDKNTFMMKDKHGDIRLVLVLEEKSRLGVKDILEFAEKSTRNNVSPIVAVVSLQGEVTYYEVHKIEPV
ncbi:endonuclease [Thermogladius sp.]|uniref:endonuclease n=1 Tax=Thermogladius sp. TaxID=2023064 RepID=UPI003D09DBC5